jgi:hypothetical protein
MDCVLAEQYPGAQVETVERMLLHLSQIGGSLTLLVHSGRVSNPEFPDTVGVYENILTAARRMGVRGMSASALIRQFKDCNETPNVGLPAGQCV